MGRRGCLVSSPKPIVPGNIDLNKRPVRKNQDGSISTVKSASFGLPGGREVLLPQIVGKPFNPLLPNGVTNDLSAPPFTKQAPLLEFQKSGKHLGIFKNASDASKYAIALHKAQAKLYGGKK